MGGRRLLEIIPWVRMTISSNTSLSCVGWVIRQLRSLVYSVIATLSASPVAFYEIISVCLLAITNFFPPYIEEINELFARFLLARRSLWRCLPISIYLFLYHFTGYLVRQYNLRAPLVSYRSSMLYCCIVIVATKMVGVMPFNFCSWACCGVQTE